MEKRPCRQRLHVDQSAVPFPQELPAILTNGQAFNESDQFVGIGGSQLGRDQLLPQFIEDAVLVGRPHQHSAVVG